MRVCESVKMLFLCGLIVVMNVVVCVSVVFSEFFVFVFVFGFCFGAMMVGW